MLFRAVYEGLFLEEPTFSIEDNPFLKGNFSTTFQTNNSLFHRYFTAERSYLENTMFPTIQNKVVMEKV